MEQPLRHTNRASVSAAIGDQWANRGVSLGVATRPTGGYITARDIWLKDVAQDMWSRVPTRMSGYTF